MLCLCPLSKQRQGKRTETISRGHSPPRLWRPRKVQFGMVWKVKYATADMLKKMAPLSSSQKNETANSVIGTKSLKIRYYGGSERNDYRIAAGVAQVNEGKNCWRKFTNQCQW